MLFIPSVWQDIRKYYEGSYVKFTEYGETLFFIDRVREDHIIGQEEDGNPFILTLDEECPYTLTYNLPHKGLFAYNNSTYMLHRIPAQQYSRGLTQGNTSIVEVSTGRKASLTFQTLRAFVQKQPYVSMFDVLYGKSEATCLPLTRRFSFHRAKQLFIVDTTPIAQFDRKEGSINAINVIGTALLPELKALAETHPKTQNLVFK